MMAALVPSTDPCRCVLFHSHPLHEIESRHGAASTRVAWCWSGRGGGELGDKERRRGFGEMGTRGEDGEEVVWRLGESGRGNRDIFTIWVFTTIYAMRTSMPGQKKSLTRSSIPLASATRPHSLEGPSVMGFSMQRQREREEGKMDDGKTLRV